MGIAEQLLDQGAKGAGRDEFFLTEHHSQWFLPPAEVGSDRPPPPEGVRCLGLSDRFQREVY